MAGFQSHDTSALTSQLQKETELLDQLIVYCIYLPCVAKVTVCKSCLTPNICCAPKTPELIEVYFYMYEYIRV